jgi:hypothetical protein
MVSTPSASLPIRLLQTACLALLATGLGPAALRAQETPVATLGDLASAEVRQQGFTLPRPTKVHVYARGGGVRFWWEGRAGTQLFASGWILDAATREVVWQMDGATSRRDGSDWIADRTLDLPAGRYEAYFADYGFGENLFFAGWIRNIDRRTLGSLTRPRQSHSLLGSLGLSREGVDQEWRRQVGRYGMQVSVPAAEAASVTSFAAPLRWKNSFLILAADRDGGRWTQAFQVRRPIAVHVYAEGEASGRRMADTGWIQDARTRKAVWEMTPDKARYAGGAEKNRRQVEVIQLPAGTYVATFVTDDSHSPADWNAQPPCDPGLYGLTLSTPADGDLAAVSLIPEPAPGLVLAELVRVKDDQDLRAGFVLKTGQAVRIYAIGERDGDEMADGAWIEDAAGKTVWRLDALRSEPAGGASKNRQVDEVITLPKGTYTLRVRTDDSHAYGDWNAARPWDPEHYGATVYGVR